MTQKYNIIYSARFEKDLGKTVEYIIYVLKNPIVASSFVLDIENAMLQVRTNPQIYPKYMSAKLRKKTYYKVKVKNYILFYEINSNTIVFRRMLYGRRNLKNLI